MEDAADVTELKSPIREGCTCHLGHPPCTFCTDLTEHEWDIYLTHGLRAVQLYRDLHP